MVNTLNLSGTEGLVEDEMYTPAQQTEQRMRAISMF